MAIKITLPMDSAAARQIKAGDSCLLTGTLYTARDAAHKRLCEAAERGEELPMDIKNCAIYFVGPAPAKPGDVIGSAGPTTSYRMDAYSPALIAMGQTVMIGKGKRSEVVAKAMAEHGAVYFAAIGGCGALLAKCIKKAEVIAYPDLGAEAIYRLEVEDFPVIAVMDAHGGDLYKSGRAEYLKSL